MNRALVIVGAVGVLLGAGGVLMFQRFHYSPAESSARANGAARFQCPMHPWIGSGKPAECTACGMDLVQTGQAGTNQARSDLVLLPLESVQVLGVQTVVVKKQPLLRTLRVAGIIGEDESRHAVISAPVEGRIEGLAMSTEGGELRRRQPMLDIFSLPLLGAVNDYKIALEKNELHAVTNAQRRLEQFGLVWEQIKSIPKRQPGDTSFGLLAPRSGTILKCRVTEGQYVKEGDPLFEIADFTTMWFTFPVYEQDQPLIQLGQVVEIQTPSLPGRTVKARVTFISPNLDAQTHAATVRVLLEHPELKLKNLSQAQGRVALDAPEVLAVPRRAILWPGNTPRVYVETAPGTYEPRPVKLGRAGDEAYELLEGVTEGERVVTSGQLLVDGQAQLNRHASPP